jgi:hypothetical protein
MGEKLDALTDAIAGLGHVRELLTPAVAHRPAPEASIVVSLFAVGVGGIVVFVVLLAVIPE